MDTNDILYGIYKETLFHNQSQKILGLKSFKKSYTINAGETRDLTPDIGAYNESGIIKLILMKMNSPDLIIKFIIDATEYTISPKELNDWGLIYIYWKYAKYVLFIEI